MPGVVRTGVDIGDGETGDGCEPCPYGIGSPNVFVNGSNVIRVNDPLTCGGEAVLGSPNVFVNGRNVHRLGDATTCGNALSGSGNVTIN